MVQSHQPLIGGNLVGPLERPGSAQIELAAASLNRSSHDPGVLAHLAQPNESQFLEELDGGAEEEPALRFSPQRRLGNRLHPPPAGLGDLLDRSLQRQSGYSLPPVPPVDEDARDTPPSGRGWILGVLAKVLEIQTVRGSVLAPALGRAVDVEDEGRLGSSAVNQLFLQRSRIADATFVFDVVRGAPASPVDAVVALDQFDERAPRRGVEPTNGVRRKGHWPESDTR